MMVVTIYPYKNQSIRKAVLNIFIGSKRKCGNNHFDAIIKSGQLPNALVVSVLVSNSAWGK